METDRLTQLIDLRFNVLSELRELSLRQVEVVQGGEVGRLISLLAVKQRLLNDLQRLESQLDPFRAQDPDRRVWRSAADRQRCREVAERCEMLLGEIMSTERQCETTLVRRRDQTAVMLQGFHNAVRAVNAYGESDVLPGSQFDVSCET